MKVKVGPRMYQMSKKRYRELLEVARQQGFKVHYNSR